MTQKIFSLLVLPLFFTVLFPFQTKAEPVPGLLGRWTAEEPLLGNNVQFYLTFSFEENRTTMGVECVYRDGSSLQAIATTNTHYDNNRILILQKNEGVVNDGVHFCRATLERSQWEAYFDGTGRMVLFVPTPYQTRLILVRDL